MNAVTQEETSRRDAWSKIHPTAPEDRAAMTALRAVVEPMKGKMQGVGAREPFDGIMGRTAAPPGVSYEADTVGGVPGWWCRPEQARAGEVIMHLHGGWFNWGTAQAFRHLVGQLAVRAGVAAFVPDYRLAPEHPFPAAVLDAQACLEGFAEKGFQRIAITGDSAGGCLALSLLSIRSAGVVLPVAAAVLSPITDLTLSGASWQTRMDADPYFTEQQAAGLVNAYLGDADPGDPMASPLFADLAHLPPIRVHVGDDEVLLDDSCRYVERAVAAGVDARIDVWKGMPHGFATGVGRLHAATQALDAIGTFLAKQLSD